MTIADIDAPIAPFSEDDAIEALAALGQHTRLAAFRLLAKAGGEGLAAGEIARQLKAPANTMSSHLAVLMRAGLVEAVRSGRHVFYRVHPNGVRALLGYLVADCCDGRPDLCAPAGKNCG